MPPSSLNRTLLDLSCLKLFGQADLPRVVPPMVPHGGVVSYNRSVKSVRLRDRGYWWFCGAAGSGEGEISQFRRI